MKRTRFYLIILMTGLGVGWFGLRLETPRQPAYRGRTLAEWLVNYQSARTAAERAATSNAVARIGTDAIPTLVDWVSDGATAGAATHYTSGVRPALAFTGFRILGERAQSAVPALMELVKDPNPNVRRNAIWCLMEAVPLDRKTAASVLTSLHCDSNDAVRRQAQYYLDHLDCYIPGRSPCLPRPARERQELSEP